MPNVAPIVVNDGTAVDTTFSPDSVSPTHVVFQNLTEPSVQLRSLLHYDRPSNGQKQNRRTIRINMPMERTDGNGGTYVEQETGRAEFIFPSSATVAERKALRVSLANAILAAASQDVVDNPEWFW